MHIGNRVTRRLTLLGEKPSALARAAGLTRSAISQWQDGTVKMIRPENLVSAADFLRCEIRWLAIGEGPEELSPRLTQDQREIVEALNRMPPRATRTLLSVATAMLEEYRPAPQAGEDIRRLG